MSPLPALYPGSRGVTPLPPACDRRVRRRRPEQLHELAFLGDEEPAAPRGRRVPLVRQRAVVERLDDLRVDVARAAHRRRVAEMVGHDLEHSVHRALRGAVRGRRRELGERDRGQQRARPGAEVLRRHGLIRDRRGGTRFTSVEVTGRGSTVLVEVLEEHLTGEVLALLHDAPQALVLHAHARGDAVLALEHELQVRRSRSCACRSRSVVRPYDLFARAYSSLPDAHERRLEQPDDCRDDLLAWHRRAR